MSSASLPDLYGTAASFAGSGFSEERIIELLEANYPDYSAAQIVGAARSAIRAVAAARAGMDAGGPPFDESTLPGSIFCPEGEQIWDVVFDYYRGDREGLQHGFLRIIVPSGSDINVARQAAEQFLLSLAGSGSIPEDSGLSETPHISAAWRCARPH